MAISVGIISRLFFVISWIIIHFGRNPDRGGSPPRDISTRVNRIVISGVLFHMCDNARIVVAE